MTDISDKPDPKPTKYDLKCPDCGKQMILRSSKYGLFYGCVGYPGCKGAHGAHPDGSPLGIPATKETKQARIRAHEAFDKLWKSGGMTRTEAYAWIAKELGRTVHMGSADIELCERVVAAVARHEALKSGGV
jgi:hypothetical protein